MSTFWDAAARTALGLAGTAGPRPRSVFEADNRRIAPDDADHFDDGGATADRPAVIPDAQAHAVVPEVVVRSRFDAPGPEFVPESPQNERRETPPAPAPPSDDPEAPPMDARAPRHDVDVRAVVTERMVDHVEVRRTETIHTIAEPASRAGQWEELATSPVPVVVAVPANAPVHEWRDESPATPDEGVASQAPTVIVAEPSRATVAPPAPPETAPEAVPLLIEIGHIEIRIESAASAVPVPSPRRERDTVPSLDEYLWRSSESRR